MNKFEEAVVYQIYPKSFFDTTGNGLGDIKGVITKLDYLQNLGVDYIWLTPFFVSPQRDNGYDVANYVEIDKMYGTMSDVDALIHEADQRGMGIMLDMVFNHTSTEHVWFQKALAGDPEYMDYYIFRDEPTNWQSKFGGSAWEYVEHLNKWYLHLFDVTQADLNWDNPKVREELKNVIRFWKAKGIKGFRFDVVNLISKPELFEDDHEGDGRRFYTDGPHVHEYLKELVQDTGIEDMITVGEMSSTSIEQCMRYANPQEKELAMCFNFHHLKVDYKNNQKWVLQDCDYDLLKSLFDEWQTRLQEVNSSCAVFLNNHDQPRSVSRFGDDTCNWDISAKMLATMIHFLKGTPYIYQGEEIGMTNAHYKEIDQYRDVESLNYYHILINEGKPQEEVMHILGERSRDNSRTPMQWDASLNAGFTSSTPWLEFNTNYTQINVENQLNDPNSIFSYYKQLIKLRKQYKVIAHGHYVPYETSIPSLYIYQRVYQNEKCLVLLNLNKENKTVSLDNLGDFKPLIHNYEDLQITGQTVELRPFEAIVLLSTPF